MGYSFEQGESVAEGATRIIRDQLAEAIIDLTDVITDDPPEAVHDCRKRLKKIRACARLVRPVLGDSYDAVNRHARDAGRELSPLRDATALAKTFAGRADEFTESGDESLAERFTQLTGIMDARRAATEAELSPDLGAIRRALNELEHLHELIDESSFEDDGWHSIVPGLRRTYRRGRKGLARSVDAPTTEHFHEWRKRVKYSRHHMELLGPAAPRILDPLEQSLHDLSDLLGEAHDIAVIAEVARSDDPVITRIDGVHVVGVVLDGARHDLERRSIDLGRRLYAESTTRFTRRIGEYWNVWR